jgi:hypothetical protein
VLNAYRSNSKATLEAMAAKAGLTVNTVYYHLCNLRRDGVINFVPYPRGRRKNQSAEIDPQKSASGQQGKGGDAFSPKQSKKDTGLEKRIKKVVRAAKRREARGELVNGVDVVMHSPIRLSGATKVG